jgi:hypothetical protein
MDYVAESKSMFNDGDYQWQNALGFDLHQRDPRLTAQWAMICTERLLAHRFPDRQRDLQSDLNKAIHWLSSVPDPSAIEEIEYEIWSRPTRDAPQTAMSKLFTAIRELHQRSNCVRASGAVISNLVTDKWDEIPSVCTSTDLYDIVLQAYFDTIKDVGSNGNSETVG